MFGLGPTELIVVGVVAVLLFGSRLPSVARSLGKSMMEFKKGMHDLQEEVYSAGKTVSSHPPKVARYHDIDDRDEATAPKFEPPAAEPSLDEPATSGPESARADDDAGSSDNPGDQTDDKAASLA